jgi:hypothetical protein
MKYRVLLAIVAVAGSAALLSGTAAYAHHSYAATYDTAETIHLEGRLVQFALRNPHSYVHIQAPDEDGNIQRWAVEWSGAGALNSQGVSRDTLRAGDQIAITARPSRVRGEFRALMVTLEADGLTWGQNPNEVVD